MVLKDLRSGDASRTFSATGGGSKMSLNSEEPVRRFEECRNELQVRYFTLQCGLYTPATGEVSLLSIPETGFSVIEAATRHQNQKPLWAAVKANGGSGN